MDLCDKHSHSWFGWLWNTEQEIVPEVRRTYAERIAGTPISQVFSKVTKRYELSFYADPKAGKTIILMDQ